MTEARHVGSGLADNAATRWPAWTWLALGGVVVACAAWLLATPLSLSPHHLRGTAADMACAALLAATGRWRSRNHHPDGALLEGTAFFIVSWPVLRLFSALTISMDLPLADATLARWDRAIGFDWLAYAHWVDGHPLLLALMGQTYMRLVSYSCATFLIFAASSGVRRAVEFAVTVFLVGLVTVVIGGFFPALAAMTYYAPDPTTFLHVKTSFGTIHLKVFAQLRSDHGDVIALGSLPGLVTFPSFHTAVGVSAIVSAWGRARVFVPILVLNLVMIASTPVLGSHYLVDLLAGAAVALAVGAAVRVLRFGMPRTAPEPRVQTPGPPPR